MPPLPPFQTPAFSKFSALCVTANVVIMVSDHADESEWFRQFMDVQNMVFFIELCIEVLLYLIAHGVVGVLTGEWHFSIVITSHRRV